MAVIEQEPEPEVPEQKKTGGDRNASTSDPSPTADSDGYETASDGDIDEREAREDNNQHQQPRESSGEVVPEQSTSSAGVSDSQEAAVIDEEAIQRALSEANEAKLEGNKLFGEGQYEEALLKYEQALQIAPDGPLTAEVRSICHANRGVCFLKRGKYEDTIKECSKAIGLNSSYMKAYLRRAEAHEKLEHYEEAIADMKKILELDPSNAQAKKTIVRLTPLAEEKREKMKEEMIAKLKDMGNSVLGKFGMSVDNFKAVKDPNTGSYSISFQK